MTKEELLGKICFSDAVNECVAEGISCENCELELSIMLDKYAKQIRADLIDEILEWLKENPKYTIKAPKELEAMRDLITYHHMLVVEHLKQLKK